MKKSLSGQKRKRNLKRGRPLSLAAHITSEACRSLWILQLLTPPVTYEPFSAEREAQTGSRPHNIQQTHPVNKQAWPGCLKMSRDWFSLNYGSNSAVNVKWFPALSSWIIRHLVILGKQKSAEVERKKKNCWFDSGAGSSCECQTEQDCRYGGAIRKLITDSYLLYCIHASVLKQQHDDPVLKTLRGWKYKLTYCIFKEPNVILSIWVKNDKARRQK